MPRTHGPNKQEFGVFMAQDGGASGRASTRHAGTRPGPAQGGGSTQVVKKLHQPSKPGEPKRRQSIGVTKSALGGAAQEHQNKDLVQLELTINSGPYKAAESTSRQKRASAAREDDNKGAEGMKRNSSEETHPIP